MPQGDFSSGQPIQSPHIHRQRIAGQAEVQQPTWKRAITRMEQNRKVLLGALMTLVLFLGYLYSLSLGDQLRYLPDEKDYVALAENLSTRAFFSLDGERPTAYRAPGYPASLALVHALGGNIFHDRVLNFFFLVSSQYILYRVLAERTARFAALLGVGLMVLYPLFFYTAGTLYPQTLASLLFLCTLFFLTRATPHPVDIFLAGLSLGALILTVPTFVFLIGILAAWFWFFRSPQRLKAYLLAVMIAAIPVGLWTVRNYSVYGSFVFISTNSGENLLLGNSENTTPNGGANVDISDYRAQASSLDEAEQDRFFRAQALAYIRSHPIETARLYGLKVVNYFNFRNELVTETEESRVKDLTLLLAYGSLLFIAILRLFLVKWLRLTPFEILLYSLYFTNALVSAVFFTRIRFRLPFDLLLILLVAIFIDRSLRLVSSPSTSNIKHSTYNLKG